jgi:hypothetical protein
MFGNEARHADHDKRREPHTQLITGVHPAHTTWRLIRWLLFLAALLSIVCGGFLLSIRSSELRCEYERLKQHKMQIDVDTKEVTNMATQVAAAFRKYWILLVIILAAVFTFFELFIHSRWKIYAIYALLAIASWLFVLYSLNLLKLPEGLGKAAGSG